MNTILAIDFGTTNSVAARWHAPSNRAEIIPLPGLSTTRPPGKRSSASRRR